MIGTLRARIALALLLVTAAGPARADGVPFLIRFASDVRGLAAGAPVQILGIRVGTVRSVGLDVAPDGNSFTVPVTIELEPAQFPAQAAAHRPTTPDEIYAAADALVRRGLRARIGTTDLMGGTALVTLGFLPDQTRATLDRSGPVPVLPAGPSVRDAMLDRLGPLLDKLADAPLDQVFAQLLAAATAMKELATGPELRDALAQLRDAATELRTVAQGVGPRADTLFDSLNVTVRNANKAVDRASQTLATVDLQLGDRSPVLGELRGLLRELQGAARSMRLLAEYLERNPNALLIGKSDNRR
ncbi:MlaD family protein [Rhodopila sp.]|jgi:paraquat-inducible protein B|uniref:MlaD family protein n=1 Tax=Rhodopila sp. TaxID=2480087 RepID=UPI002D03E4D4|nr:MlaD family protein [Rhodopila sp.]HVZ10678.1 MlaD family protein [Rhodopila sp.]